MEARGIARHFRKRWRNRIGGSIDLRLLNDLLQFAVRIEERKYRIGDVGIIVVIDDLSRAALTAYKEEGR